MRPGTEKCPGRFEPGLPGSFVGRTGGLRHRQWAGQAKVRGIYTIAQTRSTAPLGAYGVCIH